MPRYGGGSPARSSWLPRTRTSSSDACSRRQRATAPSVAAACERAEWRKSPRKTTRRARQVAISADSAASVSLVVPRGTGTPRARKLTALPMCASATSSVRLAARNAAFSASSVSGLPAARIVVVTALASPAGSRCEQAQGDVEVLGRTLLESGAREALQAADRERGQRRRLRLRVDGRRLRAAVFCDLAQALAQLRLDPLEELVHPRGEPVILEDQRVTDHDPRHARVLFAELEQHGEHLLDLDARVGVALDDLVDEREDALLDELDQPFEHLRLAREVAIERGLRHLELGGERRGGDALGARLLQHGRERLEDLDAPLARSRTLAHRGYRQRGRHATGDDRFVGKGGGGIGRRVLGVAGSPGGQV